MGKTLLLLLFGIIAGFINGMLGTGGGIIIIFALGILKRKGDAKDNFATAIATILPMSVVSAIIYLKNSTFVLSDSLIYLLPAVFGGLLGAYLLDRIKVTWLKKIFAVIVIYAGITMVN